MRQHKQLERRERLCSRAAVWCVTRAYDAATSKGAPRRCSAPATAATPSSSLLTHSQYPISHDRRYKRSNDLNMQEGVDRASTRVSTARATRCIRTVPPDVCTRYHFLRFFGAFQHLVIFGGPRPLQRALGQSRRSHLSSARIRAAILCVRRRQHLRVPSLWRRQQQQQQPRRQHRRDEVGHADARRGAARRRHDGASSHGRAGVRRYRRGAAPYGDAPACSGVSF